MNGQGLSVRHAGKGVVGMKLVVGIPEVRVAS